uniref:Tc1-like transposase DDE domain-containing protein n=1 Tax=Esox lucius TaxID=8010 RepID=A0AAY5KAJ7_ESOLU
MVSKYSVVLEQNLNQSAYDLGLIITFHHNNNLKHIATTMLEWLQDKHVNVPEWPSQSLDINPIELLCGDLKIAVHRRSTSNLTEVERICKKEWEKLPKSRSA